MKQKVLVFHPALAIYRVDFFNALANDFDSAFYFEYREQFSQKYSKDYLSSKCNFTSDYLDKGFDFLQRAVRFGIKSIIDGNKPAIVICSEFGPTTLFVLLYCLVSNRKFKIYTICDDSLDIAVKRAGMRLFFRNTISKKFDGLIFTSEQLCRWYENNVSRKPKTLVLPIIHNEEIFRKQLKNSLKTSNRHLNQYNLLNKRILLFVGRLEKVKNISFLLEVTADLKEKDWVLIIVGKGSLMVKLKQQTLELNISDKVFFVGNNEGAKLYSWYNIGQLFVLPSLFEPFGAVVNEALLSGCHILCSEVAGASSLITKENGELFNPCKKQELIELLQKNLNKITPIKKEITCLRKSKMPFMFSEKVKILLENL